MRIMTLVATQATLRLGPGDPRAERLAVCTALPIAKDGAVALCTEKRRLREGNRRSITKGEAFAIFDIVAVDAAIVHAVLQRDLPVISEHRARGTRGAEDLMAGSAVLGNALDLDHRRILERRAPRSHFEQ